MAKQDLRECPSQ